MRLTYAMVIAALAALVVSGCVAADQILINPSNGCSVINSSAMSCADGLQINISFSISAPYPSVYGTFTVSPVDTYNLSSATDSFGNQCTVPSGSSNTCFVVMRPFPISSGNGTVSKTLEFALKSTSYPQAVFYRNISLTVYHYLGRNQSVFLKEYNATSLGYTYQNLTYNYFCKAYGICDQNLGYGIGVTGTYLGLASKNIKSSTIQAALYNVSIANRSLDSDAPTFVAFVNASNRIIDNDEKGKYIMANVTNIFTAEMPDILACNATAERRLNTSIGNADSYPMQTSLNGSEVYLNLAGNVSAYEDAVLSHCGIAAGKAAASGKKSQFGIYLIILAVAVIVVVLYLILRLNSYLEVRRIREAAEERTKEREEEEKKDEVKRHENQPEEEAGQEPKTG